MSEGVKHDQDKLRMDLISPIALEEIAKVLTFGAKKYDAWNWSKGISFSRLLAATLRHTFAYMKGVDTDPESGISHISHAMVNLMFLAHFIRLRKDLDDRNLAAFKPKE